LNQCPRFKSSFGHVADNVKIRVEREFDTHLNVINLERLIFTVAHREYLI